MLLVSDKSFTISKKISGDTVVFEFEPNVPVEMPDDFAREYLDNEFTKTFIKIAGEDKAQSVEPPVVGEEKIELPVVEDPPKGEFVPPVVFTEEDLDDMGYDDVFGIAKEMGLRPLPNWKIETLIKKILDEQK